MLCRANSAFQTVIFKHLLDVELLNSHTNNECVRETECNWHSSVWAANVTQALLNPTRSELKARVSCLLRALEKKSSLLSRWSVFSSFSHTCFCSHDQWVKAYWSQRKCVAPHPTWTLMIIAEPNQSIQFWPKKEEKKGERGECNFCHCTHTQTQIEKAQLGCAVVALLGVITLQNIAG